MSAARFTKLCTLSFAAFALTASLSIFAQPAEKSFDLKVPEIIYAESGSETEIPLEISAADTAPRDAMVLFHGIPPSVALTEGRLFASGVWAVKLSSGLSIKIQTASDTDEESDITVSVVTLGGETLDKAASRLVIKPRGSAATQLGTRQNRLAINTITQSLKPNIAPEDEEKILILMERGDQKFQEGKVHAARLFYTKAASMGWADGALGVAKTYDPDELVTLPAAGPLKPDIRLAKEWYEKARNLGSQRAAIRLQQLL
jgi:hypothetical protein